MSGAVRRRLPLRLPAALFCLLLIATAFYTATLNAASLPVEPVAIVTSSGTHVFKAEIASTPDTQAQGLMFRRSIAPDRGMLFTYSQDQEITMWMRNTFISLDMIFITSEGKVHHIVRNTEPFSENLIVSAGPVRAVLEVAAGTANRIGLKSGDTVRHKAFNNAPK